ncbi:MAG: DUF1214 domain-containing protein [Methyloceanibacter sp.]|uniref:DUF1214 domain-containing protein n=1 Tax=Methyloceanibacter sp. TaxID=1965321 RepID=UPI003C413D24
MTTRSLGFVSIFCVLALLPITAFAEEEAETQAADQSTQQAIDDAKETTNDAIEAAKQTILDAIDRAKEITSSTLEAERDATERALDEAKEATKTLDQASEAAREVLERAKQATSEVLDKAKEAVQGFSELAEGQSMDIESDGQRGEADVKNLVERSYQYVAMYNVNNKFAAKQGGWNTCDPDTELKDHTMREIARPNNDTLYLSCLIDLRKDPVILEIPAFDSKYVSLMVTGYDHYVNIPMSTRLGDFRKPEKMLLHSARTKGYDGEPVEGVDRIFEATGDFVSAVFRIMPHASDPERFKKIVEQMKSLKLVTLSEYKGGAPKPIDDVAFPPVGETDADVFENNLLEVMQFVFNHTTFDPENEMDQAVLAAYEPLGIEPGNPYHERRVANLDGKQIRQAAERIQRQWLTNATALDDLRARVFQPKGETDLEAVVAVSVVGPRGIPQEEAVYPQVSTADGEQMNAMHDYVIRMTKDELPPAGPFWSLTLYDLEQGFFIANDQKKYSVGENAGMKLNEDGGIEIYIAAEKPGGVPEENWLPIERKDLDLSPQFRVYVPDLEKMETWETPKAEKVSG